jgi:hypothetical protein
MKRLIFHEGVARTDIEAALDESGWCRVDSANGMPEVIRYKSSWVAANGVSVANYLENAPFDAKYLMATDDSVDALREKFGQHDWLLSKEDLVARSWEDDAGALRIVGRLGLMAHGEFDTRVFSKLMAFLLHSNETLQRFALYALSNVSWPEFGVVVRRAIDEGLYDDGLAIEAQALLGDLERSNWNAAFYRG